MPTLLLRLALTSLAWAQAPEPAPPAPAAPSGAEEPPLVEGPSIAEYVEAPYPPEAEAQGLEATVKLRLSLSATGELENVEVIGPAGHGFDEAAVDAVLAMKWNPARTAEGPVAVVFDFDYGFVLEAAEPPPDQPVELPVNLEGQILEMATREPIAGALVAVDGAGPDSDGLVAETDAEGRFALRGVPVGTATVRLRHVGHVDEEKALEIVEGQSTVVKLWMRAEAYRDNEVVALYERPKDEVTRRTISIEEIRRVPGTFGDPVRVVQTLPGAARTPFGTGLLVIRGADPEDSGVYIDGIRVPIIYHLTGTTSVLSPDLIQGVDYLPGGYAVQFGRTMGGTVNVTTKTEFEENGKIVWGTDILDSQLYYEGKPDKNKKHGLAVGVRRSYIDVFVPIFTGNTGFVLKPRYWDYQVKWVPELGGGNEASAFVYGFDDVLRVATPDDFAQGPDQDTQGDLSVNYNSHRAVFRWKHPFSEKVAFELLPSFGVDTTNTSLGAEFGLRSAQYVTQVRSSLTYKPAPELVPGLDFLGGFWGFDFLSAVNFASIDDPLAERESVLFDGKGSFWSPDLFLRANLRPLGGGSERLLVSPGLRLNTMMLVTGGELEGAEPLPPYVTTSLDPRVLARFEVVPERFWVKGASGLYHQLPQPQESVGLGTQTDIRMEESWSTSFGWEQKLTQAITYDVDVFYRRMTDLIVFDEAFTGFGTNPFVNGGSGRAYGLEVMARHDPVGRFFGWVSYTLSRASRKDPFECELTGTDPENTLLGSGACWYLFDFDQTHIFSAQAGYDLPRDFGISAQVQLVTGNPSTELNAGVYDADADFYNGFRVGDRNADRLPPYFQTSLRFDKLWTFRKWQLETYVDLINAVRGVNPEFTIYNYDYTQSAYVRGLPFIPNIGIEAKFFP
jgi:TonB family protein